MHTYGSDDVLRGTGLFRGIWCSANFPLRIRCVFLLDFEIQSWCGAHRKPGKPAHACMYIHTLGMTKQQELLGNSNSSYCFSFIPLWFFFVLWMVVFLYNCVYNLGYLSFEFFVLCSLFCIGAEHNNVQKCMYLTRSLKLKTWCYNLYNFRLCLFILRSSTREKIRDE